MFSTDKTKEKKMKDIAFILSFGEGEGAGIKLLIREES